MNEPKPRRRLPLPEIALRDLAPHEAAEHQAGVETCEQAQTLHELGLLRQRNASLTALVRILNDRLSDVSEILGETDTTPEPPGQSDPRI